MKILLVSPTSDFMRQLSRALVAEGHVVCHIDDRVNYSLPVVIRSWRWLWRIGRYVSWMRRRSNHALQARIMDCAQREHPGALLATKGMNVKPPTLAALERMHIKTIVWFPDNAANEPYASWVRTVGPLWGHFFSFDSAIYEQMPESAHHRIHVLPFGVDPELFEVGKMSDREREHYRSEVCLIGAPYPERVRLLEQLKGVNIKIWGWSGWQATSLKASYMGALDVRESAKAYHMAKICLNTNIHPLAKGVNLKTFEITAAGGFQLTDHPVDLDASFVTGKELDTFSDENDFREKVHYWLNHPDERVAVAAAGRKRLLQDHTLRQRVRTMVSIIS